MDTQGALAKDWELSLKQMAGMWNDFKTAVNDIGNDSLGTQLRSAVAELLRANDMLATLRDTQQQGIAVDQAQIDKWTEYQAAAAKKVAAINMSIYAT